MGQARGRASRTSPEIRRAIQGSSEGISTLAARYGLNPKTVRRWRGRGSIENGKTGPKVPKSTVLSLHEEATAVAIRRLTLLPLDDCFYALRTLAPALTRASLHRCLRRHGVSRLPAAGRAVGRPGDFDLHMVEIGDGAGALCLFIAVEQASKYVFAELHPADHPAMTADFLQSLSTAAPIRVRAVVTERGGPLAAMEGDVARGCRAIRANHRDVEPRWTSEQIAGMNRLMRAAAHARAAQFDLPALGGRLAQFTDHYNGLCRLKALGGLTPRAHLGEAARGLTPLREQQDPPRPSSRAARGRDPESTRAAILQAARLLVARVGPEGLSLAAVARIAGVNRGTAYQHFASRNQLITEAAAWSAEQLHRAVFGELNNPPGGARAPYDIATVADRLAGFAMENPEMCRAWLFQFIASPDPSNDPFWNEWCGSATRFHETPMAQDGVDTEIFSITQLAGAFLWPTWARVQGGAAPDLKLFARRFAREAMRAALHGAIRPECFPEIVAALRERPAHTPPDVTQPAGPTATPKLT